MGNTMTVTVNQKPVSVKEYKGKRVVTFRDVDTVHGRPEGTARKRFNDNRKHFIEGVDYYKITPSEFRTAIGTMDKRQQNDITLVTESGYLMLAKSFTDDLSWTIQRELVNCYFNSKSEPCTQMTVDDYEYYDKTYRGEPVLSLADFAQMSGLTRHEVYTCILKEGQRNKDYYFLEHESLAEFKKENPRFLKTIRWYIVITRSGFEKLCRTCGIKIEKPQCFIEAKSYERECLEMLKNISDSDKKAVLKMLRGENKENSCRKMADDYITTLGVLKNTRMRYERIGGLTEAESNAFGAVIRYVSMALTTQD
ncbi:hypothetical protein Osc1_04890 [Hominimerdicola sp. 21CYCFAH17_S]